MNHPKHIDPRLDPTRTIRAPRGSEKTCKTWLAEAAYRMIQNNLDPEVAEHPHELVVYGGIGRAARNWECFDQILASLKDLEDDETLLVQSGKPVGVFRTHADAPRVLIANSNLVPHWANWEHFNELDAQGPGDVRPDDRRQLDLHRQPGHRAGHLRNLRRGWPPALRRQPDGPLGPHRRPGRHGRRAAAGRDPGRRLLADRRMPAEPHRLPPADSLRRREGQGRSTRRWRCWKRPRRTASRSRSACSATRPTCSPSSSRAASRRTA